MRSSALALVVLLAAGPAAAQQPWHGPVTPQPPAQAAPPAAPNVTDRLHPAPARRQPERVLRDTPHVWLAQMIDYKFRDPAYAAALDARKGIPSSFNMPEEQWIRKARAEISRLRKAPPGVRVLTIPRAQVAPSLDGRITAEEWKGALRLALAPEAGGTSVLLLAHGGQLYLAAHATPDRTEDGYDQFRFWFHIDLSPYLRNERVFLAGKGWFAQLREVMLPHEREPILESPPPGARLTQKTDWNIFERSRGASRVEGHRQYEMAVELDEVGIFPGVPFPAFFEIEGDPVKDAAGKFKARTVLGTAGSREQPVWLHVTP